MRKAVLLLVLSALYIQINGECVLHGRRILTFEKVQAPSGCTVKECMPNGKWNTYNCQLPAGCTFSPQGSGRERSAPFPDCCPTYTCSVSGPFQNPFDPIFNPELPQRPVVTEHIYGPFLIPHRPSPREHMIPPPVFTNVN